MEDERLMSTGIKLDIQQTTIFGVYAPDEERKGASGEI